MVLGLPRSGTAWAANWLSDGATCYHDPLEYTPVDKIASMGTGIWGIACTGSWMIPGFVEAFDCPKIIIDRDRAAVRASLSAMGLAPMPDEVFRRFDVLKGHRVPFDALFRNPLPIWKKLRPDMPMNEARHFMLRRLNVQRDMAQWSPDSAIMSDFVSRL